MKSCPYCNEKIKNAAIKCKYCGNFLNTPTNLESALPKLKENKVEYITFISILLLYDLVTFYAQLFYGDRFAAIAIACFTVLHSFCAFYVLKFKSWAKKVIAISLFFKIFFLIKYNLHYMDFSFFSEIFLLLCLSIYFLVMADNNLWRRAKLICLLSATLIFLLQATSAFVSIRNYRNEVRLLPIVNEYVSEEGYKIKLPSNKWKFVRKQKVKEIIRVDFGEEWDIGVVNNDGNLAGFVYGLYVGELNATEKKQAIDETTKIIKETYSFPDAKITNEKYTDSNFFIEYEYPYGSDTFTYCITYKFLKSTLMGYLFFGTGFSYDRYKNDINKIILAAEEVPLKSTLHKVSANDLFVRYSDAVVLIKAFDKKGELIGVGTGFNMIKEGGIITNLHVVLGAEYCEVEFPHSGSYNEVYVAALWSTGTDLIALRIDWKNLPVVDTDMAVDSEIGDKIFVIGNPQGLINTLSEGIISGFRDFSSEESEDKYYQITASISPGSSGSPVFDAFGRLIGVASAYIEGSQNLNFCIPIDELDNMVALDEFLTVKQFSEEIKKAMKE